MAKIQFKPYHKGFEELRQSAPVAGMVAAEAEKVAAKAGPGFESSHRPGRKGPAPAWNPRRGPGFQARYRAIVYPEPGNFRAMHLNASQNVLVKALGGGWKL